MNREQIFEVGVIAALTIAAVIMGTIFFSASWSRGVYWVHVTAPVAVTAVVEVEYPVLYCFRWALGCFDRDTGVVYLKEGMPPVMRACVLGHEATSPKSHANGWDHPGFNEPGFSVDCGNGEMVPG